MDYSLTFLRGPYADLTIAEMNSQEVNEVEELCRTRLLTIKREVSFLQQEQEELETQKRQLVRAERLYLDEAASKYCSYPIVDQRYLFLELLGKGGFSEVFKAFDLVELRYVACKLHELEASWSEERQKSYLKHVIRESSIQQTLSHSRFVKLIDVFKIDHATLVTVLDLCEGGDLDQYLKEREFLTEKEARVIIHQVFSGLKYLNEQKQKVIHYDLKPANILFHKGEVRISDFGLSKRLTETERSIELTSQGAGTMSYLPPECLSIGHRPPSISSAVDVWSCGIILFQMLYGKRPFGPPLNTYNVADAVLKGSLPLEFPSKPVVSDLAKEFIRKCLSINPDARPAVSHVLQDPFFKTK